MLSRALAGTLRGQGVRIVTPEDFVILKALSTRERDLEDAATVLSALAGKIDTARIETEVDELGREIPDHDVAPRYRRALSMVRS